VVPLNSEKFADPVPDEGFGSSTREAGQKVFFPNCEFSCASRIQLDAFRNQKKRPQVLRLRPIELGFF